MNKLYFYLCTAVWILSNSALFSQDAGNIQGAVFNASNGSQMMGVTVSIRGAERWTATDLNGYYEFNGLAPGAYALVASIGGFANSSLNEVHVVAGETTIAHIKMAIAGIEDEIVVSATLESNTEAALLGFRQRSLAISDALSGEEISRTGVGNVADAVTKITGASVVGGKYVYIRGLGDRYTSTHLNGTELPTSDPDVKAFQADLFPSSILDNIVTLKSFTPDKPGNFSGGVIDIGTKAYPNEFSFDVSFSGSFNENTTFNDDYLFYKGGGSDWLGKDDGLRALPELLRNSHLEIPNLITARTNAEEAMLLDQISKSFEPVMSPDTKSGPVNRGFSMSVGNRKDIFGRRFGFLASLTYSRNFSFIDDWQTARWKLTERPSEASSLTNQSAFTGSEGKDSVNWGGLMTANYSLSDLHELGANFIYTQGGASSSKSYVGQWPEQFSSDNAFLESRVLKYTERNLSSYQLNGSHLFPNILNMGVEWNLAFASTEQDEPDTRIFTDNYSIRTINGETQNAYSITPSVYNNPARYFRKMKEDSTVFNINASFMFTHWSNLMGELKIGGTHEKKERDFNELRFEYASGGVIRYDGDPESFFSEENTGVIGYDAQRDRYLFGNVLQLSPDPRGGDYQGDSELRAYYGMIELPLTETLKTIAGVRMEQADFNVTNGAVSGLLDDNDILPSWIMIYEMTMNMNLRTAYGRTLARPNFREKAPYANFDLIADGIFSGNPDLERTLIDNYDLRWEWYPSGGELVAASFFYKDMQNPIERSYNIRFASEFGEKTFQNVDRAVVSGLELEFRKKLDWLVLQGKPHMFGAAVNVSLIESEVDIPGEELAFLRQRDPDAGATRRLQGQSPFLVNVGLNYDHLVSGTSVSLFYNVFGERLDEVGVGGAPDSLEQSRDVLDFTFVQSMWDLFVLKFTAKNLLDSPVEILQSFNGNDFLRSRYQTGRTFSLSLSFKP